MFELLLIACVSSAVCERIQSPMIYRSEERCAINASLLAGMVKGRHAVGAEQTYLFQCAPLAGGQAPWVVVDNSGAKTAASIVPSPGSAQD